MTTSNITLKQSILAQLKTSPQLKIFRAFYFREATKFICSHTNKFRTPTKLRMSQG